MPKGAAIVTTTELRVNEPESADTVTDPASSSTQRTATTSGKGEPQTSVTTASEASNTEVSESDSSGSHQQSAATKITATEDPATFHMSPARHSISPNGIHVHTSPTTVKQSKSSTGSPMSQDAIATTTSLAVSFTDHNASGTSGFHKTKSAQEEKTSRIAGGVVGSLLAIAAIAVGVLFYFKKR